MAIDVTEADVATAVFEVLGGPGGPGAYTVEIHAVYPKSEKDGARAAANGFTPFAFVNTNAEASSGETDSSKLFASKGVVIHGVPCGVKRRRETRQDRLAQISRAVAVKAAKQAVSRAKKPKWQPELYERFPQRESTLCPHAMVAELAPDLQALVEDVFLPHFFPQYFTVAAAAGGVDSESSGCLVSRALRWTWERQPKSLRVKELFETVETYAVVADQISRIRARAASAHATNSLIVGPSVPGAGWSSVGADRDAVTALSDELGGAADVEHIYDVACGHGLLGVLLALRFPHCQVTCVDLERRECFGHYLQGFQAQGLSSALANVSFVVGDMAQCLPSPLPRHSFVACVHGCNEANQVAIALAQKAHGGFAAMPCCVRAGLYGARFVRHVSDDVRHAIQVGAMAAESGAHTVTSVDRRITNRALILFGGYRCFGDGPGGARGNTEAADGGSAHGAADGNAGSRRHADRLGNWNGSGTSKSLTLSEWNES